MNLLYTEYLIHSKCMYFKGNEEWEKKDRGGSLSGGVTKGQEAKTSSPYSPSLRFKNYTEISAVNRRLRTVSWCYDLPSSPLHVTLESKPPTLQLHSLNPWVPLWTEKSDILNKKSKSNAIPVTGLGGLYGCEMLRIPHCLDNRFTVNFEILATCSSTYSPVRTSQEAYLVSIK
jgi:hypothetical protein